MARLLAAVLLPLSILSAMFAAWGWAIWKWRRHQPLLPIPAPRSVPWGMGSVVLVMLAWVFVNIAVYSAYVVVSENPPPGAAGAPNQDAAPRPRELSFTEQMLLVSAINGTLLVLIPPLLRATSGARASDLGLTGRGQLRNAWIGVVAFLLVSPPVYVLNGLAVRVWKPNQHPLEKMVRSESSGGIAQLAILSAVLLAPAAEELIFRGVIQGWLRQAFTRREEEPLLGTEEAPTPSEAEPDAEAASDRAEWTGPSIPTRPHPACAPETAPPGRWASFLPILLTSVLFAAVHLPQWPAPLAIFFLSLGLGVVYERTGSLVSCFIMHAMFNGLGTLLLFLMQTLGVLPAEKAIPEPGCVCVGAGPEVFQRLPLGPGAMPRPGFAPAR